MSLHCEIRRCCRLHCLQYLYKVNDSLCPADGPEFLSQVYEFWGTITVFAAVPELSPQCNWFWWSVYGPERFSQLSQGRTFYRSLDEPISIPGFALPNLSKSLHHCISNPLSNKSLKQDSANFRASRLLSWFFKNGAISNRGWRFIEVWSLTMLSSVITSRDSRPHLLVCPWERRVQNDSDYMGWFEYQKSN